MKWLFLLMPVVVLGQCEPLHCKPKFHISDSCAACFTRTDVSGALPDSVRWAISDLTNNIYLGRFDATDSTLCMALAPGSYYVSITVWNSIHSGAFSWGQTIELKQCCKPLMLPATAQQILQYKKDCCRCH